jgi:RNA polymerase sigma-70 factor (ECF subfamily)
LDEDLNRDRTSLLREPAGLIQSAPTRGAAIDLESVYASQREYVWLSLQRMGIQRSDLEDVFQEVFMIVHKRLHTYRPDAKLTAWLYGICLRSAASHRRRAFRRRERPGGVDLEPDGASPWQADGHAPDERLHAAARQARLNRMLDGLDPEHRAMVVMYEIEELSCAQISELTGLKVGTIHSRLHNARQKLAAAARRLPVGDRP